MIEIYKVLETNVNQSPTYLQKISSQTQDKAEIIKVEVDSNEIETKRICRIIKELSEN